MSTGIHRSLGEAATAVKTGLHNVSVSALAAAARTDVQAAFGYPWPIEHDDTIAVTAVRAAPQDGTVSSTRQRQQDIYVDVEIDSYRQTASDREVHDIAYGVLDIFDRAVRADPTLGGAALWCFSDDLVSDGATEDEETGEGRICAIRATYKARVMVRS
ncbi:hypothetical protein APR04_003800 [Promicromonospora umidemergens]|uniref:Tail terminator n=1 Tax=Promicromonospora umidemergens TaxID=629679 RepID=A0ABP8XGY7_9MICO|nr:hypothetical protein [Promicromonospora umidemergens]MCP2284877.1 hypothetical protein [Promicromonospora umidemergens]